MKRLGLSAARRALRRLLHAAHRSCCASCRPTAGAGCSSRSSAAMARDTGGYFAGRCVRAGTSCCPTVSPKQDGRGRHRLPRGAVLARSADACALHPTRSAPARRSASALMVSVLGAARRPVRVGAQARVRRQGLRLDYPRPRWHPGSPGQPAVPVRVRVLLRGRRSVAEGARWTIPDRVVTTVAVHRRARRPGVRARARTLPRRQAGRREGAALLDRLRPACSWRASAARPSTRCPRFRSAAT